MLRLPGRRSECEVRVEPQDIGGQVTDGTEASEVRCAERGHAAEFREMVQSYGRCTSEVRRRSTMVQQEGIRWPAEGRGNSTEVYRRPRAKGNEIQRRSDGADGDERQ